MTDLLLAFKRAFRRISFPILLVVLTAVIFFAPMLGREEHIPNAGLCDLDKSETSERLAAYLTQNGYILCEDESAMRVLIQRGALNCGAVIPEGFEALMYSDNVDNAVVFITSPLSYSPEIYQSHIAAAIFGELAPILTADQLSSADITVNESVAEYRRLNEDGMRFTFSVETVGSAAKPQNERARTYLFGAASVLIFSIFMYTASDLLSGDIKTLSPRIGMRKTLIHAVAPGLCIRILGVMLALSCSAMLSWILRGDSLIFTLLAPLCVYTLIIATVSLLASAILADTAKIQIFTFFILTLSLIFCPIYLDISLTYPALSALRILIPPYWLWICADSTLLCAASAPIAAIAAFAALYLRFSKRPMN